MEEDSEGSDIDPHSYRLLLSCPTGLSRSQVFVDFSAAYDRVPCPNPELEGSITKIWDQRIQRNPSLYNGKKFRHGGHVLYPAEDGSNKEPHVFLHLGLTDYRTFIGTNLSPLWMQFIVLSEDDAIQCQHTSSPLGNAAVVETIEKRFLCCKEAIMWVNSLDILSSQEDIQSLLQPGAVFDIQNILFFGLRQPEEIGISSHEHKKDPGDLQALQERVSQEMFDGIIREVVEEIGVPASTLSDPLFIGISRRELNVRPTAFFYIKCSLESQEVNLRYITAQDGYESTQLYLVPKNDLEKLALRMPGCHRGGFALYNLMVKAAEKLP